MKFVKCQSCGTKIPEDKKCEFASYKKIINNEQIIFCCARCANEYEKKQKTTKQQTKK